MNSNWRNRPTTIDYISKSVDYIISIDESGNANLGQVQKAKQRGVQAADSERHFTVTACAIAMSNFESSRDMVMDLKRKYWTNALYDYKGTVKRVCFHSREIRGRKEAFSPALIDYSAFIADLSQMMADIPITLYASHIDKVQHVKQYIYPKQPYDLCMTFVLERIMRSIPVDATCIIVAEARGAKEDKELLAQIKDLLDHGNQYHSPEYFKKIKGVYFNPKWCKRSNDQMSYWELELADLCAYPIHKYFVYGTADRAYQTLLPKIYGYPNIYGRGLKSFP